MATPGVGGAASTGAASATAPSVGTVESVVSLPGTTVVVMNTTGVRGMGYLYPPKDADADIYQVWQSPFSGDALPALTAQCVAEGKRLLA